MLSIDLYHTPGSAPCASVEMVARAVGLDVHLKEVDLQKKEQLQPEYIHMNPQHTVPTINDHGLIVWESRAILTYLCETYPDGELLFPNCPRLRAVINQRLYFDMGTLYHRFSEIVYPIVFQGAKEVSEEKRGKLREALEWLDGFISKGGYVAGDSMTVADYAIITTMATMEACGVDLTPYEHIQRWMKKCKDSIEGYKEADHSDKFGEFVGSKLKALDIKL